MGRFKVASLFSGAGGLDWGFKEAGFEIVFANDILEPATLTYSRNFGLKLSSCRSQESWAPAPGEVLLCDIEQVDFTEIGKLDIDVVVGGPPCQDFSIVRGPEVKRRGIEVKRGRLYAHFVRALAVLQPKAFVFENVPGIVSANRGLAYKTILEDLRNLNIRWDEVKKVIGLGNNRHRIEGYEVIFSDIVDMTKLGLPQKRERLIIIGVRRDVAESLSPSLFWSEFRRIKLKVAELLKNGDSILSKYPLTPLEVFEGDILPNLQKVYEDVMREYEGVWDEVGTPRAGEWKRQVWDRLTFSIVDDYLWLNEVKPLSGRELDEAFEKHREIIKEMSYYGKSVKHLRVPDGSSETPEESPSVLERMKRIPPGENHEFVRGTRWEVKGLMSNIYRRAHPLVPAPTVIAYGGGGTWGYHYERNRSMLTNRERARLQSFPDTFLFSGSFTEVRAQIGEAVPPIIAKRIAEVLAEILSFAS